MHLYPLFLAKIQYYKFRGYEKDNINGIDVVKSPTIMFIEYFYRKGIRDYIPIDYEEYYNESNTANKNKKYTKHS